MSHFCDLYFEFGRAADHMIDPSEKDACSVDNITDYDDLCQLISDKGPANVSIYATMKAIQAVCKVLRSDGAQSGSEQASGEELVSRVYIYISLSDGVMIAILMQHGLFILA